MWTQYMAIVLASLISASSSFKDENTKKVSIIDIFHQVVIPKTLPNLPNSFIIYGKLLGFPAGYVKVSVVIEKPDGKEFATSNMEGELFEGDLEIRGSFTLVKFEDVGRYFIRIYVNGEKIEDDNKYYIDVKAEV